MLLCAEASPSLARSIRSLAAKKTVPASAGTFPTHGPVFVVLLVASILVVGALTFLPVLALGPIAEQVSIAAGQSF